jgi:hypothetical protein
MRYLGFTPLYLALATSAQDPSLVWPTLLSHYPFPEEVPRAYVPGNDVAFRDTTSPKSGLVTTINAGVALTIRGSGPGHDRGKGRARDVVFRQYCGRHGDQLPDQRFQKRRSSLQLGRRNYSRTMRTSSIVNMD